MSKPRFLCLCLIALFLLLLPGYSAVPSAESLIVKVDDSSLVKASEEDAVTYYEQNKESLQVLADYLLDNEPLFESRPVILNKDYNLDRIGVAEARAFAARLFSDGTIHTVWSENDDPLREVHFIIGGELDVYEQACYIRPIAALKRTTQVYTTTSSATGSSAVDGSTRCATMTR